MELSYLAKIRKASQNTDFDMQDFFEINKTLHSVKGGLTNIISKLTENYKHIKQDSKEFR